MNQPALGCSSPQSKPSLSISIDVDHKSIVKPYSHLLSPKWNHSTVMQNSWEKKTPRFLKMCKDSFYKLLFKCDLAVGCSSRDIISSLYMPNLNTLLCLCSIFCSPSFPAGHLDVLCGNSAQDAYFQPRQFAENVHMVMEDMFDDQLLMNMIPAENFSSSAAVCATAPAQWPHGYFPSCTDYYTNSLVCIISTPDNQSHVSFKFLLPGLTCLRQHGFAFF